MIKQTHIWFDAILSPLVLWTQQLCRREGSRQPHAVQDGFVLNKVYLETPTKTSWEIMGTLRFPFILFQVDFDMLWPALSKWCWPFYDHFMVTLYTLVSWWRTRISSKSVANGKWLQTCLKYIPLEKWNLMVIHRDLTNKRMGISI
jgi:hypothetical protein